MIHARGLRYAYRPGAPVLDGVDLELDGGLALLVGPNGCGKSTLLRLLAGVERPDGGEVALDGFDLWRYEVAARRRLAYVPERPELDPYLTLAETARFVARLHGCPRPAVDDALERLGLGEFGRRTVEELSLGQRRRAHLALAMLGEPHNLLLDEPLEALDVGGRELVLEWLDHRLAAGATAVVVSHVLEPLIGRASTALRLENGRARALPAKELDALAWRRLAAGGSCPHPTLAELGNREERGKPYND